MAAVMGYIRLLLSLMVVIDHLTRVEMVGRWAVIGFFFLSGYGITAALQGKYKGRLKAFWCARFWRLYPLYLVCWLLAAISIWQGLELGSMGWGEPWSMFMLSWRSPTPIPQAWMFAPMLFFYGLMALGISLSQQTTAVWLGISALFYMVTDISIAEAADYYSMGFASLPFSVGASWYWLECEFPQSARWDKLAGGLSYPIFLCHWLIGAIAAYWLHLPLGWLLLSVSMPAILAFSWMLLHFDTWLRGQYDS